MHARSTALIFGAICASIFFANLQSPADASPRHHHHVPGDSAAAAHRHKHSSEDAAAAKPSHHRRAHEAALLAQLREQNQELYQLRHERNVFSARTKHLASLVRKQKAAKARHSHKHASAQLSRSESAHAHRLAAAQHQTHAAHLHALHLAMAAHARRLHEQRLAAIQAHEAKAHAARMAEIAAAEARREKHPDKPSGAAILASGSGLPIWQGNVYAAQVPVKVVMVDLNDPRIKVSALLARNGIGTSEPFTQMINRVHPNIAVTGTFFSLDNLRPVGDIVINGNLAYFGGMGTALAITPGGRADMITLPWGHHHDWSGYETVVACGPRLLQNGAVVLDPHAEHFKDRHMLAPNSRIAVGITGHNQLVFCMTRDPIYLGRLAKVMHSLGCKQAMNLDAGTSTGFYVNGHLFARPGRWLTNAIVVYSGHKRYDAESEESASGGASAPEHLAALGTSHPAVQTAVAHRGQL